MALEIKEDAKQELDNSIKDLKSSPTFALSSSSKELSHSNMWVWLFNYNKEYIKIFFPKINIEKTKFTREEGNRDITIWCDGGAYVIENKLKSVPYIEQLEKYKKDLGNKFKGGVLAAPEKPNFTMPENSGWRFISYDSISDKIENINNKSEKPNPIIQQYTKDLKNILNVISKMNEKVGEKIPINDDYEYVECIRMDDICKKLQASRFCEYLQKSTNIPKPKKDGYELVISSDYSNKQSIVDVKYVIENKMSIGIQIQNKQYRRFVQEFENHCSKDDLFKKYKENWFGEKKEKNLTWDGNSNTTGMKNDYCSYNTKNYCFVYQYITLDDDNCSFGSVADKIRKDMKTALSLLDKNIRTE